MGRRRRFTVRPDRADLDHLAGLAGHGDLTPVVAATYPLAEVAAAIRRVETGHTRGKVVVDVRAPLTFLQVRPCIAHRPGVVMRD